MKPGTCNKSTETDNKSTQIDDSFTEYLKKQTQEKQQEPPKASQSQSKSSVPKKPYVPRFLIIHSEVEGKDISLLSPFLIEKAIMSIAGEPKSIKNLRSGDLLIQCTKQPHEANLLKMKTFCGLKCTVKPHKSLNTSKGIVRCPALSKQSCEHILEFMGEQGVTDVRRINVHRDGVLKPTNTFVFTFDSPVLPANVKIGFIQAKVDVYIPNPLRCYKCQVFGHHENKCAVKPGTCNKSTETHNNSTQTDDSFTEYLKHQTQEKQQEPSKGKPQEKGNPSRPGQTLKPATLEMIRKDEEKKKKEEKDKLKKQQKDERRQQYIKEKAQKDKEEAEKAILAQKNPFSVFKKDDEEDDMDDDSVVFTDSSSSDHLPKGTLSRLPTT